MSLNPKARVQVIKFFLITLIYSSLIGPYTGGCASTNNVRIDRAREDAIGHNQKGVEAVEAGDYSSALVELKRSISLNSGIDNQRGVAVNYLNLGRLYLLLGMIDDGKIYFDRAVIIGSAINDQFILSEAYASLGRYFFLTGKSKEAIGILEKAIALDKDRGYQAIGAKLNIIGMIYIGDDRVEDAERVINTSLGISKGLKMEIDMADSYKVLGDIYLKKGNYKQARELYENALSLLKETVSTSRISVILYALGTLSFKENDIIGAREFFLRAYGVDWSRGDYKREIIDLDMIIEIYNKLGEKDNVDEYKRVRERLLER